MKFSKLILIAIILVVLVAGYVAADWYSTVDETEARQYVGRSSCADCHQQQCQEFVGSHHDLAMDVATEDTVLADFGDVTLEHYGITSRMFRDGDRFMINTEGPDGQMQDFEVKWVFGVEPLQQYMVGREGKIGRYRSAALDWRDAELEHIVCRMPQHQSEEELPVTDQRVQNDLLGD